MSYKILMRKQESETEPLFTYLRTSTTVEGVTTYSDWTCETEADLEEQLETLQSSYLPEELRAIVEIPLTFSVDATIA